MQTGKSHFEAPTLLNAEGLVLIAPSESLSRDAALQVLTYVDRSDLCESLFRDADLQVFTEAQLPKEGV